MADRTITLTIPHQLTQAEVRSRLQNGITDLRTKYGSKIGEIQENWTDNQLDFRVSAMGQGVTGRLDVLEHAVKLEVHLPWLLAAFANRVRPQVEQEARRMLEKK